jgi:hypothetical protein
MGETTIEVSLTMEAINHCLVRCKTCGDIVSLSCKQSFKDLEKCLIEFELEHQH